MKDIPKIELHCHLDGSVRPNTVFDLAMENDIELPTSVKEELNEYLIAPIDCDSLVTYLKRFDLPISVMQTKEALRRVAFELVEDNAIENVKYLEIRFAPFSHTQANLTLSEIIESVLEGINIAKKQYEIEVNLILAFMRDDELDYVYNLIDEGRKFIGHGVVALDLCAAEHESFVRKFVKAIKYARKAGFKVTIHAGETGFPQNVVEAIEYLNATRIGHGVAIIHDEIALDIVSKSNTFLEICPTSNIQTKAFASYQEHPINEFLKKGVKFSVGTDNRTVSNITLSDEYNLLASTFGWGKKEFAKVYNMSIDASYASSKTKEWLRLVGHDYYGGNN